MNNRTLRVAMVSMIMIMSSLAGCLSTEEPLPGTEDSEVLGKVIVSTYHVEQLVSAVAGDTLDVELLAPSNVPVHDFEPSANDILRLQGADLFLYHGLNLEPWVETTLSSLSTAAPDSVSTHGMPTGETTLDYESILISELCELAEGPFERTNLSMNESSMPEIHAEHVTHSMWFPEMDHDDHDEDHDDHDEDHDGHDDDHDGHDDDHDGHDDDHDGHDDDHGDHDDHAGHGHASPMETITNPSGCPSDYVIVIYELEKGDVVIEFEAEDDHNFNMTVLKMGGGHAHHHHGHDEHDEHDGHDDEITEEDCERRNGTWEEAPDRVGQFYCDFGHGEHDDHDDHDRDDHDDEMTPEMVLQMADSNNDSHISWDEFWVVFNSDEHDDDDHGDNHDDHNGSHDDMDEATEEYMMGLFYAAFNESDMYYYNGGSNDAGDGLLNISELAIFVEEIEHVEEDMESASITILLSMFDADDDGNLSLSEFTSFMETMNDDQDNHDGHNGSHDDHQEVCYDSSTGSINSAYDNQTDCEATGLVWTDMEVLMMEMMFNMYDNNSDGYINASELGMMMEMGDDGHHDEEHGVIGFANLHVEAEGEYGFLLPSDVTMHVLISRDAHEGHGHDDHDDHGDEDRDGHEDHDDHGDEDRDEHDDHDDHEEIPYDPHSWLDPLAFKVQIDIVLDALITAFPDGQESFTANANAYKVELDSLIDDFEDTFGEEGTCSGKDKTIVANHNAYSYLAQRYDIEFTTIHGVDPEGEPSAEDIAEVVETIEDKEITVFFVEEFTDTTSVDSIVSQSGVTVLYLYTMELPPSNDGDDYLSLMKKNLDNLTTGIGC